MATKPPIDRTSPSRLLRLLLLSLLTMGLAILMTAYCFLQLPVHKEQTEQSLRDIEGQFIDRSQLNQTQAHRLDHALANIRWNERTLKHARQNLWQAGIAGFFVLALLSALSAFLLDWEIRREINLKLLAAKREQPSN